MRVPFCTSVVSSQVCRLFADRLPALGLFGSSPAMYLSHGMAPMASFCRCCLLFMSSARQLAQRKCRIFEASVGINSSSRAPQGLLFPFFCYRNLCSGFGFCIASIVQPSVLRSPRETGPRRRHHREKLDKSQSVIEDHHLVNDVCASDGDFRDDDALSGRDVKGIHEGQDQRAQTEDEDWKSNVTGQHARCLSGHFHSILFPSDAGKTKGFFRRRDRTRHFSVKRLCSERSSPT